MDVAKLQRVNQLARDLKSFGIVDSMDDAYSRADGLIHNEEELEFLKNSNQVNYEQKNNVEKIEIQAKEEPKKVPENWEAKFVHLSSLYREQEARLSNMADIMMKMQHAMNDMISEINGLKNNQQTRTVQVRQEVVSKPQMQSEQPKTTEPKKEENNSNNNPRSGGYTENDVAIDKIFYFGTKR